MTESKEEFSIAEVARSLYAVQALYPRGISKELLAEKTEGLKTSSVVVSSLGSGGSGIWMLGYFSEHTLSFTTPPGELLKAAIEKGLKFTTDDVLLISADKACDSQSMLRYLGSLELRIKPKCCLVFGEEAARLFAQLRNMSEFSKIFSGEVVVTSKSLDDIALHESEKRDFWRNLKTILAIHSP